MFKELCSTTDLALRAIKATVQAIVCTMASLVVLECHLWLNLTEIKDADWTALLDSSISLSGLFCSVVDGFVEHYITAQKSLQAMRHFLPKRASSSTAPVTASRRSSRLRSDASQAMPPPGQTLPISEASGASAQVRARPRAYEAVLMLWDRGGKG